MRQETYIPSGEIPGHLNPALIGGIISDIERLTEANAWEQVIDIPVTPAQESQAQVHNAQMALPPDEQNSIFANLLGEGTLLGDALGVLDGGVDSLASGIKEFSDITVDMAFNPSMAGIAAYAQLAENGLDGIIDFSDDLMTVAEEHSGIELRDMLKQVADGALGVGGEGLQRLAESGVLPPAAIDAMQKAGLIDENSGGLQLVAGVPDPWIESET